MLSTRTGDDFYPGTAKAVDAWPGTAPGDRGVLNTLAPTHFRLGGLSTVDPKPPVLWIRGTADVIVSDTSLYDLAHLGTLGAVPGWPGPERYPAQPMIAQTRAVLDAYAADGGRYREVALERLGPRAAPRPPGGVPGGAGRPPVRGGSRPDRLTGQRPGPAVCMPVVSSAGSARSTGGAARPCPLDPQRGSASTLG